MNKHDPNHPIWPILRIAVGCIAINSLLATILFFTASKFDWTEHRTIIYFALGATASLVGVEGGIRTFRNFITRKSSCENDEEPQDG